MTIEMIDKWVTSFRFNEIICCCCCGLIGFLIDFIFCRLSPEVTSVWGVSAVAILDSSVNCVCVWSTKKLTMPAANCNNSQMIPGITRHELPRNWPAVRWKWIKFIQFKRAVLLHHIMPICVASTSVSVISQTPWNTACRSWHDVLVLFQNPAWQAQTDTAVSLWVSRAKYQFCLRSSSWPFLQRLPRVTYWHMVTWFGRQRDAFGTTENAFFCAFITLRSQFHLHHRSQRALMEIVSKITPNLGLVF